MAVDARAAVDSVNKVFGRHPGHRALHAKGTLLKGTFTPLAEAAALTCAPHFAGGPLHATFRFSNGSGDPSDPDYQPDPRGLAAKIYLEGGTRTDIVCVSSPRFPTRTPKGFVELVAAQGAGPLAAVKLPVVFARHPEALRNLPVLAPTLRPPASYAVIPYYGIHAFKWIDEHGGERWVRYQLAPAARHESIAPWAARRRGPDYLQEELRARLATAPIVFTLSVQIAIPGDPIDDPSAAWSKLRRVVPVARYELTDLETDRETGGWRS
jgi:catalase